MRSLEMSEKHLLVIVGWCLQMRAVDVNINGTLVLYCYTTQVCYFHEHLKKKYTRVA